MINKIVLLNYCLLQIILYFCFCNGKDMSSRGMTTNKQRRIGVPTSAKFGGLSSILAPIIYIYCCAYVLVLRHNGLVYET